MRDPGASSAAIEPAPVQARKFHPGEYVFLALLLAAVAASCWPWMTHLGLENDEAHFLPAAVKLAVGSPEREPFPAGFYLFHRPLPLMTGAFLGAFDAYLYALVFAVFGVSVLAFRVTNLVLALLVLALAYGLARSLHGRVAAVLTAILLASDLEFVLHAPTNYGPIHVQALCAVLSVLLIYKWMAGGLQRHLLLAAFLLGLGFTEKLTFVLFVGSLLVSLTCFYGRTVLSRLTLKAASGAALAFLLGCLPVLIYTVGNPAIVVGFGRANTGSPSQWAAALTQRYSQLRILLSGQSTMSFIGPLPPQLTRFSVLWYGIWLALACSVVVLLLPRFRPSLRACAFLVSLCAGVVILSAFFPESGRTHHLMLTYPFLQCAVAIMLAWICALVLRGPRVLRYLIPALLAVPVLAAGVSTLSNLRWYNQEVLKTGGKRVWSSAILDLSAWVNTKPDHHFVFSSWGLYRSVFGLSGGKASCREFYFPLLAPELPAPVKDEAQRILKRKNSVLVFSRILPDYGVTSGHLFALAKELGLRPRLLKEFFDRYEGKLLYQAYAVDVPVTLTWRQVPAESIRPMQSGLREISMVGPSPLVLRARAEKDEVHLLGFESPLNPAAEYVRFRIASNTWSRFGGLSIQLVTRRGEVVRKWDRPFYWSPPVDRELPVEVGPDLYPDYFLYSGEPEGSADSFRVFVDVKKGSGLLDLAISGLATGAEGTSIARRSGSDELGRGESPGLASVGLHEH